MRVSDNPAVIIIAEAGVNHNGSIDIAKQLIDSAANAGVDYIKFQTWITEDIVDINAPKAQYQIDNDQSASQYEMLKRLELSFDEFRELKAYCENSGVRFLSTPDDFRSLDFLVDELGLEVIKVGSGELTNIPFLKKIGSKGREVILSTGMGTIGEVEKAYYTLLEAGAPTVSILHCTSNYPAAYDSVNLKAMQTLALAFNTVVGYSDHTEGNEVSIAAVALGAKIIEKHFTLDKTMDGPDHKASIDPQELRQLVSQIRNVEKAISGSGAKVMHASEVETKKVVSKGIYLTSDVKAGEVLTDKHLIFKRPVGKLSASDYGLIIGRKLNKNMAKDSALGMGDVSFE
jgi:N-acetylneuraminate synthase